MDKWREALVNYMVSVAICDGGEYGLDYSTGCLDPLTKEETELLFEEVDKKATAFMKD